MKEINKILLICKIYPGLVCWLVLMDTQQQIGEVDILLQVAKMRSSKQQPLKYLDVRNEESDAKIIRFFLIIL